MLRTILFSLVIAIVFFVAKRYFVAPWVHPDWKLILAFYFSVSLVSYRLVETGLQDNRERFVLLFLTSVVVRLILSLFFVGFFLFRHIEDRRTFILDFLVLYIFYAGFEIWALTRKLRRDS